MSFVVHFSIRSGEYNRRCDVENIPAGVESNARISSFIANPIQSSVFQQLAIVKFSVVMLEIGTKLKGKSDWKCRDELPSLL